MWEFKETTSILRAAEQWAVRGRRSEAIATLRQMSLDQFGYLLWRLPNDQWPALSAMLPAAPTKEAQLRWTGNSGDALLAQSFPFVRSVTGAYYKFVGGELERRSVLDFGCGYGRVLRLMEYFVNVENLHGCDTLDDSLALCHQARIGAQLKKTNPVPDQLPYPEGYLHLVYALSVFTHLPAYSAAACLAAIHRCMHPNGLLAVTIRPVEYWAISNLSKEDKDRLVKQHELDGIAYHPHGRADYGDTSITVAKFAEIATRWRVVATDWHHTDAHQHIILLQPA